MLSVVEQDPNIKIYFFYYPIFNFLQNLGVVFLMMYILFISYADVDRGTQLLLPISIHLPSGFFNSILIYKRENTNLYNNKYQLKPSKSLIINLQIIQKP
jgi:hypothetical protein